MAQKHGSNRLSTWTDSAHIIAHSLLHEDPRHESKSTWGKASDAHHMEAELLMAQRLT